ncbi:MAG: hypothetical protein OXB94_11740 [Nitrospira sp.]|nr:hypothetical protein [Nitrospira sp.]
MSLKEGGGFCHEKEAVDGGTDRVCVAPSTEFGDSQREENPCRFWVKDSIEGLDDEHAGDFVGYSAVVFSLIMKRRENINDGSW